MLLKNNTLAMETHSKLYYLCADDFGWSSGVNDAIVLLSERRVIDGTSIMVFGSWSAEQIQGLKDSNIDLGMHLDFTSGLNDKVDNNLHILLVESYLRVLNKGDIRELILLQFEEFERRVGRPPSFVDGHQHIHQFPVIREELLKILEELELIDKIWIRNTVTNDFGNIKANLLNFLGGSHSKKMFENRGCTTNRNFLGVYNFSHNDNYRKYFNKWLLKAAVKKEFTLIMCHPGLADRKNTNDTILESRLYEFEYLSSDQHHTDVLRFLEVVDE